MANTFKGYEVSGITTETVVYTGPASTQVTVIGLTVANTSTSAATVDIKKNSAYVVKNAPVPVGGALVAVGGDQKLVIEDADTISVISTQTVDAIVSALEIT